MRYRALIFDLFGTLVLFRPKVPTLQVAGTVWRSTMEWMRGQVERDLPEVPFDAFVRAVMSVTEEIVRARSPEYHEVPSPERFRRVLVELGLDGPLTGRTAERLCEKHMEHLAASTEMPAEHADVLRRLRAGYRTALVSNFDHGPTAHRILTRHGIDAMFGATVISADFGRRKPHPAIFGAALEQLGVAPAEALFIGDTVAEDVRGARATGMDVVWIDASGGGLPAGGPAPTYTISRLTELETLLESVR